MVTRFYLIRHGEAEGNVLPFFQGTLDTALTEKGVQQTACLAARFRDIPLDAIITSPLRRARVTAETINQYHGLPLTVEPDLHELDGGDMEGVPVREIAVRFPAEDHVWNTHIWDFQAPHGESMAQVWTRISALMERLAQTHAGKTVAVCAHGCVIRCFLCYVECGDITRLPEQGWADNTAVSLVEYDTETGWRVVFKNDASHLPAHLAGGANVLGQEARA